MITMIAGDNGESVIFERLHKIIAMAGITSRRKAERLILEGRVDVDGKVVRDLTLRVNPLTSIIKIDGKPIRLHKEKIYIAFYKPRGVITAMEDPFKRRCIGDFVRNLPWRLFHAGRLDRDSEGLVILTNDGNFAERITHPRFGIEKRYIVKVEGCPSRDVLERMRKGIRLDDGPARVKEVYVRKKGRAWSILEIVMIEGKKREIRRLCYTLGHPVKSLKRIAFGPVTLRNLKPGGMRLLEDWEIRALLSSRSSSLPSSSIPPASFPQ